VTSQISTHEVRETGEVITVPGEMPLSFPADTETSAREASNGAPSWPAAAPIQYLTASPTGNGKLSEDEARSALRALRDEIILKEFPGSEPERCILRDLMINKILDARVDEPEQFTDKVPLWLRERTDPRQMKFLARMCEIVVRIG
jgi:hypothetical protein